MNILAIDTSHPRGSAAISVGGRIDTLTLEGASSHLVEMGRAVSRLLSAGGIGVRGIDRVAIVTGPGGFTGLRVGMAYLKGLYAARPFQVVVMTSLELLAHRAAEKGFAVSPMIDARKDEVYAALYGGDGASLEEKIAPRVVPPAQHLASVPVEPTIFVGSGALRYRALIESAFGPSARLTADDRHDPDTSLLCRLAESLPPISDPEVVTLEPFYLRPESVTLKPLRGVSAYEGR